MSFMRKDCQCCGREDSNLIVASSALGAVSFAYCVECNRNYAEPLGMLNAVYESCGGDVAEWMLDVKYYNPKTQFYMPYRDYLAKL